MELEKQLGDIYLSILTKLKIQSELIGNYKITKLIYIGDGLIPQVERFASKYVYNNKPTPEIFNTIMQTMNEKAEKATGNKYLFVCNEKLWYDLGDILDTYLAQYHTDGTYLWSNKAGDYVSVGASGFNTFNWQGNQVSFKVDRTFSREFGLIFFRP